MLQVLQLLQSELSVIDGDSSAAGMLQQNPQLFGRQTQALVQCCVSSTCTVMARGCWKLAGLIHRRVTSTAACPT